MRLVALALTINAVGMATLASAETSDAKYCVQAANILGREVVRYLEDVNARHKFHHDWCDAVKSVQDNSTSAGVTVPVPGALVPLNVDSKTASEYHLTHCDNQDTDDQFMRSIDLYHSIATPDGFKFNKCMGIVEGSTSAALGLSTVVLKGEVLAN